MKLESYLFINQKINIAFHLVLHDATAKSTTENKRYNELSLRSGAITDNKERIRFLCQFIDLFARLVSFT